MKSNSFWLGTCLIMLALMCGISLAQTSPIDKGSKLVDGGLAFSAYGGDLYDGHTLLTVDPAIGKFVRRGLVFGGRLLFQRFSSDAYSQTSWGLGPEMRYYFDTGQSQTIKGATYPYLKTSMTYLKTLYEGDESATDFLITLGAGSAHMLSDAVAFTMAFDFNIEQYKPDGANAWISGRYFDFKLGFSFFLY